MEPSDDVPDDYEWSVHWSDSDFENGWKPNNYDYKLLNHLGDHGLLLSTGFPGGVLNFGVRIPHAKGVLPFNPPYDDEGMYVSHVSNLDSGDIYMIMNAQHWSIMKAYELGYKAGQESIKNKK